MISLQTNSPGLEQLSRDVNNLFFEIYRFRSSELPKISRLLQSELRQLELNTMTENRLADFSKNIKDHRDKCLNLYKKFAQLDLKIDNNFEKLAKLKPHKSKGRNRNNHQTFNGVKGDLNDTLIRLKKRLERIRTDIGRLININSDFKLDKKLQLELTLNLQRFLNSHNNHTKDYISQLRTQQADPSFTINNIPKPHLVFDVSLLVIILYVLGQKLKETISKFSAIEKQKK